LKNVLTKNHGRKAEFGRCLNLKPAKMMVKAAKKTHENPKLPESGLAIANGSAN